MSIFTNRYSSSFGYYAGDMLSKSSQNAKSLRIKCNILNLLGIIPVISGIARIILNVKTLYKINRYCITGSDSEAAKTFLKMQILRGSIELLGLGLLFLIPDLIVSIGRAIEQRNKNPTKLTSNFQVISNSPGNDSLLKTN